MFSVTEAATKISPNTPVSLAFVVGTQNAHRLGDPPDFVPPRVPEGALTDAIPLRP
jgi:hypothetical protein